MSMAPPAHVLLVEDEQPLAHALADGLRRDGFAVHAVRDGAQALAVSLDGHFDLIVLDLMLPRIGGFDVCLRLRAAGIATPVLVLTARDGEHDQLRAFSSGADDYLTKPFSYQVLRARLRALLRRGGHHGGTLLSVGDLVLDRVARRCQRGGVDIELTPREFTLLELLMSRPGQVVSKRYALDMVWDLSLGEESNVLEVYIGYLRRKIDLPFGRNTIRTVRGAGYRLDPRGG